MQTAETHHFTREEKNSSVAVTSQKNRKAQDIPNHVSVVTKNKQNKALNELSKKKKFPFPWQVIIQTVKYGYQHR
jgi:hypothetical protein